MLLGGGKTARGNRIFLAAMMFRVCNEGRKPVLKRAKAPSPPTLSRKTGEREMPAAAWLVVQLAFLTTSGTSKALRKARTKALS